jgi:metallophosphoesterase (TIGR00282 family)
MNILFLGDIVGKSGREIIFKNLPELKRNLEIDIVIINGENAAGGFGITPQICENLYESGANVITSGNHIWDKREIIPYINRDKNLLRPENFPPSVPGHGNTIVKDSLGRKVLVINVMGRVFMDPLNDPIESIEQILKEYNLGIEVDAIIIDIHGEATSEKMAIGHIFDGKVSLVVGTHTHVPTSDTQIFPGGTGYQSDAGMCGDYDSVIGGDKKGWQERFRSKMPSGRISVSEGDGTLSGIFLETDNKTGLAKQLEPVIIGPRLINRIPKK